MLFSRRGLVNPSTLTFPNINLKKTIRNLNPGSNVTDKMAAIISVSTLITLMREINHFLPDVTFPSWLGKSVNLNLLQNQSD